MANRITTADLFNLLRNSNGHFFKVRFECRTASRRHCLPAGRDREMLCRTGVKAFRKGKISQEERDKEDFRNGVLTCWSVGDFHQNVKDGKPTMEAAFDAWRRIDILTVKECSLLDDDELPPEIVDGVHQISNEFRLQNMPK